MKINKKWLLLGGGTLVIAALGLAVALNQGGLFKGAIYIPGLTPETPDYTADLTASKQNLDTSIMTVTGTDGITTYDVMGDPDLLNAGVYSKDSAEHLVFNLDKAKEAGKSGPYYFRLESQKRNAAAPAPAREDPPAQEDLSQPAKSAMPGLAQDFTQAEKSVLQADEAAPAAADANPVTPVVVSPVVEAQAAPPAGDTNNLILTPAAPESDPAADAAAPAAAPAPVVAPAITPDAQLAPLPAIAPDLIVQPALAPASKPITNRAASLINLAHAAGIINIDAILKFSAHLDNSGVFKFDPAGLQAGDYKVNVKNALGDIVLVPIKVVGGKLSDPPVKGQVVMANWQNPPKSQTIDVKSANYEVLGVSFRSLSNKQETITGLTFQGYISTDKGQNYTLATSDSINLLSDVLAKYKIIPKETKTFEDHDTVPSSKKITINSQTGEIAFTELNFTLETIGNGGVTLVGTQIVSNFSSPNDVLFKYVLKSVDFKDQTTSISPNLASDPTKNDVIMTLPADQKAPPAGTNLLVTPSGAGQSLISGEKDKPLLSINFSNNNTGFEQTVRSIKIGSIIDADADGKYKLATESGVKTNTLVQGLYFGGEPNKKVYLDQNGEATVSGLSFKVPADITNSLKLNLYGSKVAAIGDQGRPALANETNFKYFVKDVVFGTVPKGSPPIVAANEADEKAVNLPIMTLPADKQLPQPVACTPIDHFAFSPTPLIYDENKPVPSQFTDLYAADAQGKDLGGMLIDNGGCGSDFEKAGLIYADNNFTPALHLELKDENGNLMASDTVMINTPHDPKDPPEIFKALEGYVSFERVTPDLKLPNNKYIRFTTNVSKKDFTIPAKKSLEYNKTYSLSIYGTRPIIVPPKVPADVAAKDSPAASYQIKLIPKKSASKDSADKPTGGNTYNTYNTYNTTNTTGGSTQPSATPCLVNGKTFYLAGGPDSGYCKDLQNAGVMQVDQPAETGNVRYVNALTAMRVANDLGAKLRTRNLSSTWTDKFTDNFSRKASSTELKDFKTVVAASVLTGRIDPTDHSTVTLDPLDEVNVIECLSTYLHTIENSVGVPVDYNPNNVPADILREYHNNPDWKWIAEAYSFGVEYKMITKNQYNAESIFDFTSRGDLANMIARLKGAVKADPSLIKR